jgi:hypothetical protein
LRKRLCHGSSDGFNLQRRMLTFSRDF